MSDEWGVTLQDQRRATWLSTIASKICFPVWTIFTIIGIRIKEELGPNETQFAVGVGVLLCAAFWLCWAGLAQAQSPAAKRGVTFVRVHCAQCHAIDKVSPSPLKVAPPFRTLHTRYPIENLAEAFAEGIVTGHPTMPEFRLDPGQIADLLAYFRSLER